MMARNDNRNTAPRPVSHPNARNVRNVMTVASGKGGVGKTWFSVTLSHALCRLGRQVLVFDGDLGMANVDIQLGLTPDTDLGQVLAGSATMQQATTIVRATGAHIIAGQSGMLRLADAGPEQLRKLHNDLLMLAGKYDHVLLDLSAGVDRAVRTLATHGGPIIVVTTDEPTALTDAYAFIKLVNSQMSGLDFRVVVNMATDRHIGIHTYEKLAAACRNFLQIEPTLLGVVRADDKVKDAIRNQMPLLARHPSSKAGDDVEKIARSLING